MTIEALSKNQVIAFSGWEREYHGPLRALTSVALLLQVRENLRMAKILSPWIVELGRILPETIRYAKPLIIPFLQEAGYTSIPGVPVLLIADQPIDDVSGVLRGDYHNLSIGIRQGDTLIGNLAFPDGVRLSSGAYYYVQDRDERMRIGELSEEQGKTNYNFGYLGVFITRGQKPIIFETILNWFRSP